MYFKDKLEVLGASNIDTAERTKLFTLTELKRFTNNFSKDRVLGQGGQGTVYKGMLKDGQVIAVKRSRALEESQWKQFINEDSTLFDIVDPMIIKDGKKKDIMEFANLAKQCLNQKGLERPTMKEVTMVLEGLRYKNSSSCLPHPPYDNAMIRK
uniref:Protein kinase domain-containing protein n=1 Tax=Chenopodium quinoa TaxID=63459 RepID=A0A803LHT0_CHEQI